ncbi:hypothetical protein [Rhizobium sullae]|uniref:hypothetical protein n=1 Tax=Rhizobium sullae TaxID=50338 RepID=UPI0012FE3EE2|nr:hypothetical protein [Rhizobium sullae]
MTYAFALAPATVAAPVDFLRLPLVAVGGFALLVDIWHPPRSAVAGSFIARR